MKFLLTDVIPGVKLENVQDPYEWFSRMVDAELLSPDNLYFLATLLSTDGREDLKRELLKDQQFGGKLIVSKHLFVWEEPPYVYQVHKMQFVWTLNF